MHTQSTVVLEVIKDYISYIDYYETILKEKSYRIFFLTLLVDILKENDNTPPLPIIERFRDKMSKYKLINPNNDMFEVGEMVINDVIDSILK